MMLFLFVIRHYAFLISIGILSYGIGRVLLKKINFDGKAEQFSFCTTLGLSILAYFILFIGTIGVLHHWLVLSVMAVIFLLCWHIWIELFQMVLSGLSQRSKGKWIFVVFFVMFILFILPILLMPLYPPTAWDSTMYHLAYAKIYTHKHAISLTPYLRFPVFPQTNEMLFTLALLFYDEISAQLMQFLMMIILSVGLYAFGYRHFSTKSGIWAIAILLSSPMIIWLGSSAYIDMGLTLFVTMTFYSFFNWICLREIKWLILGSLFIGFAVGSKYPGFFFLILCFIIVSYIGFKERKFYYLFLFLFISIGIASPWYIRNWYYTGNPIFPFLGKVFGYGSWNSQDVQGALNNLMHTFGTKKNLKSFLLLPWNLTFNQQIFLREAPISSIYLFAMPLLFLSLTRLKIGGLFCIVCAYIIFWFSTSQILRYIVPVIPLLSLAIAASFENFLGLFSFQLARSMKNGIIVFIISILLFSPGWLYAVDKIRKEGYPPYTKEQIESYLTQKLPSYPAYKYLNQKKGRDYFLYALYDENMAYFADGVFMGDWFGPGRFSRVYSRFNNPQALYQELQVIGADYFLINRIRSKINIPGENEFPQSLFRLIYKNDYVLLFEITKKESLGE